MPNFMRPFGLDQTRPLHTPSGDRATSAVRTTRGSACLATFVSPTRIASSNRGVSPNLDVSPTHANRPKFSDRATQTDKRRAPAPPVSRIPPIPAKRTMINREAENPASSAPASERAPASPFAPASELAFASDCRDLPPPYSMRTGLAEHYPNGDVARMNVTVSITTPPR
jgi:hypothetical protein